MTSLPGGITRVFHRIWLGSTVPRDVREVGRAWIELNPRWELRTWHEWNLPALRNQLWFDHAASHASRADIARLELLYRFGGVYLDTDEEALQPIEPMIAQDACFVGFEDDQWLGTAIIGAAPRHPFIRLLIDGIDASMIENSGEPPNVQTGPKYVTARWREYTARGGTGVATYPASRFYPYHFSEPDRAGGPFPGAVAVHRWANSWSND